VTAPRARLQAPENRARWGVLRGRYPADAANDLVPVRQVLIRSPTQRVAMELLSIKGLPLPALLLRLDGRSGAPGGTLVMLVIARLPIALLALL
jgi:hypothetical protein